MAKDSEKDEGSRAFSVLLHDLEDGALHAELSAQLRDLNRAIAEHAEAFGKARGTLTLSLTLSVERGGGPVVVGASLASKAPRTERPNTVLWLTKGHNLTADNPRQQKLPLRDVTLPAEDARDVTERA
jgi:hypothetical protein